MRDCSAWGWSLRAEAIVEERDSNAGRSAELLQRHWIPIAAFQHLGEQSQTNRRDAIVLRNPINRGVNELFLRCRLCFVLLQRIERLLRLQLLLLLLWLLEDYCRCWDSCRLAIAAVAAGRLPGSSVGGGQVVVLCTVGWVI